MSLPYYNQDDTNESHGSDPFGDDADDLTEETGSAGTTQTPGPPAPGGYVGTGAEEIVQPDDDKDKKNTPA